MICPSAFSVATGCAAPSFISTLTGVWCWCRPPTTSCWVAATSASVCTAWLDSGWPICNHSNQTHTALGGNWGQRNRNHHIQIPLQTQMFSIFSPCSTVQATASPKQIFLHFDNVERFKSVLPNDSRWNHKCSRRKEFMISSFTSTVNDSDFLELFYTIHNKHSPNTTTRCSHFISLFAKWFIYFTTKVPKHSALFVCIILHTKGSECFGTFIVQVHTSHCM